MFYFNDLGSVVYREFFLQKYEKVPRLKKTAMLRVVRHPVTGSGLLSAVGSIETECLPGGHKSNSMLPFMLILLQLSQSIPITAMK